MYVARKAPAGPQTRAEAWRPSLDHAWLAALVVLCALFFHAYVAVTPWTTRAHDCAWHLDYVHAVRDQHAIPGPDACPECTQPPAYYVLAATWLRLTTNPAKPDTNVDGRELQILDACLGFGTALFLILTALTVLRTRYEKRMASALIAFWPELYVESAKVGNDVLLYFFAAGALFWLVSWKKTALPRHLVLAALFAAGAANAKNNGYVMVATLLASLLWTVVRAPKGSRRAPPGTVGALATLVAGVGFWLFSAIHWKHGVLHPDWDGGAQGTPNVTNKLANFLLPAPWSFFRSAYLRQPCGNFWEYLFRSSLFGEWSDGNGDLKGYAYEVLLMGLVLFAFLAIGLGAVVARGMRDKWRGGSLEILLTLFGFVAFLLYFRTRFPFYFHNDFRFVLPILGPCAILAAIGFERHRARFAATRPTLAAFPVWMMALFCALSTQFLFRW